MAGPTNKGNILVVDDEPQITRVLKTTLSAMDTERGLRAMARKLCK